MRSAARIRKGGGAPAAKRRPSPVALSDPAPASPVVELQRLVGNRAVGRALHGAAPQAVLATTVAGPRNGGAIQRFVWTKATFRAKTAVSGIDNRGKTIKEIERLLDEYHALHPHGEAPPQLLSDIEKSIDLLEQIRDVIGLWLEDHTGDTSRKGQRRPALLELRAEARKRARLYRRLRAKRLKGRGLNVTEVPVSKNQYRLQVEGDVKSVLAKVSPLLDLAAPNSGDSGKVELELKIPVEPTGVGFIGFRGSAEIERGMRQVAKVRFELAVTGGAQIPKLVELKGELGGYLEAQGANTEKAMTLISYGMYRRFRESRILPNEVANFMWGGSTSVVGWRRAERWAANVEKANFKKQQQLAGGASVEEDEVGSYVETGGIVAGGAKAGIAGAVEGSAGAKYTQGKHYDYESVSKLKKAGLGKATKPPTRRGQIEKIGESVHSLELSGEVKGGPFKGGIKLKFGWSTEGRKGRAKLNSFSAELSAAADLPMSQLVAEGIGGAIPPIVASIVEMIRKEQQKSASRGQDAGVAASILGNASMAFAQLAQLPAESFKPKFSFNVGDSPDAFAATIGLKLTGVINEKFEGELKAEITKNIEVNAGAFAAKVEQNKRILRLTYKPGEGWKAD